MARREHFPDPTKADARGLVAVTETMTADMLLEAYSRGIFPWTDEPVRWFSPDPRAVFFPETVKLPSNLGKIARRQKFRVTRDTAFGEVIRACAAEHAHEGEWIGPQFVRCYSELHELGHAHSVEVWQNDELVGGLYGVQLGAVFSGESMFYRVPNASKVAFASLVELLWAQGVQFIDAQVLNEHTASLGAVLIRRSDYLALLAGALELPTTYAGRRWPAT